jgi:hypothetical protein
MEDDGDTFEELRDDELVVLDPDVLRDTERLLAELVLEGRKPSSLLKEVAVGGIEVLDSLLETLTVDFLEPCEFFLEFGEFLAILDEVIGSSCGEVFVLPTCEEMVVEVAARSEVLGKKHLLV